MREKKYRNEDNHVSITSVCVSLVESRFPIFTVITLILTHIHTSHSEISSMRSRLKEPRSRIRSSGTSNKGWC